MSRFFRAKKDLEEKKHFEVKECDTLWLSRQGDRMSLRRKSPKMSPNPGSMLLSQFSAIFDNFRQKIGFFFKKQCYDQNFA
jgi:hypothetical protein